MPDLNSHTSVDHNDDDDDHARHVYPRCDQPEAAASASQAPHQATSIADLEEQLTLTRRELTLTQQELCRAREEARQAMYQATTTEARQAALNTRMAEMEAARRAESEEMRSLRAEVASE